jgi:hypothetical protein
MTKSGAIHSSIGILFHCIRFSLRLPNQTDSRPLYKFCKLILKLCQNWLLVTGPHSAAVTL